jgi:hypothetical protein
MQLISLRPYQPRESPERQAIPYSSAALRQDLDRVRGIWEDCQASRDRNAIYTYLTAVYGLVAWWAAEGRDLDRGRGGPKAGGFVMGAPMSEMLAGGRRPLCRCRRPTTGSACRVSGGPLMRPTEPGKHYGEITAKAYEVVRVLLWIFHDAALL